ncbi:hypothetical protein ACQ4M3_19035 [Leptolyngbya sp. AN03gr2]|uniref:hypothetical protein n=1 Tax=Leptolyngbya sp. AN03gr2 TaxID=3423364 RepID=UPI003D3164A3
MTDTFIESSRTVKNIVVVHPVQSRDVVVTPSGIQGPPGASADQQTGPSRPASETLSALRAVVLTTEGWAYAQPSESSSANRAVALTLAAANAGTLIQPLLSGIVEDLAWNWHNDQPIFLNENGTLSQVPNLYVIRVLGFPLTPTSLYFNPEGGIL